MATITLSISVARTVASLDAATIAQILQWVQTNIKDKLPADSTLMVQMMITP